MSRPGNPLDAQLTPPVDGTPGDDDYKRQRQQAARESWAELRREAEAGELPDVPPASLPPSLIQHPPPGPQLPPLKPGDNIYIGTGLGEFYTPEQASALPSEMWPHLVSGHSTQYPTPDRKWYERWGDDIADSKIGGDINRLTDDTWHRGDSTFGEDFGRLTSDVVTGAGDVARKVGEAISNAQPDWLQKMEELLAWLADHAPVLIVLTAAGAAVYASSPLLTGSRRSG